MSWWTNEKGERLCVAVHELVDCRTLHDEHPTFCLGGFAWVPCVERLPADDVEVLVFERGSTPYVAWHSVEGGGWDAGGWGERPKPSHWMPLPPAPPKE